MNVTNGGQASVQALYIEVSGSPHSQALNLDDAGKLTFAATRFSYYDSPTIPTYLINGFDGELTKVGCLEVAVSGLDGFGTWTQIIGNGTNTQVLDLGTGFSGTQQSLTGTWQDTSSPAANAAFFHSDLGSIYNQQVDAIPSAQFITDRLALLRSVTLALPTAPANGLTAVRLYRVSATPGNGQDGLYIQSTCANQVAAPSFSPTAGAYGSAQSVTISTTTNGATINYTTDGTTPTESNGTVYSSPVNISVTTTLQAIAYETGYSDSTVTSGVYTINSACAAPSFSPAAGAYGPAQSVTISTTTSGASINYTTNGTTPSNTVGTLYSTPVNISSTCTLEAIAYETGYSNSTVTSGVYTINGACAAPSFSPAAGAYGPAQSVTISTTTSGATINYTTNGTTPSNTVGTLYSTPVNISSTCTLEAIAYETGYSNSTVTSGVYTINGACAAPTFSPAAGAYGPAQTVTISTTTSGATIRYTTNGTTPSSTVGTVYSSPVTISSTCTLEAIAYETGYSNSTVTSGVYTINGACAAPSFISGCRQLYQRHGDHQHRPPAGRASTTPPMAPPRAIAWARSTAARWRSAPVARWRPSPIKPAIPTVR